MRKFLLISILFLGFVAISAQTYIRPSSDAYSSGLTISTTTCGTGSLALQSNSTSMSAAYSSKSGAGPTGSSSNLAQGSNTSLSPLYATDRIFSFTGSSAYTATISTSMACNNNDSSGFGYCYLSYSTDGGSTWNAIGNQNGLTSQATLSVSSVTIPNIGNLKVALCVRASYDSVTPQVTSTTATIYDVWLSATATSNKKKVYSFFMQ